MMTVTNDNQTAMTKTNTKADTVVTGAELDQLHVQVDRLLTQHAQALDAEYLKDDVERLLRWIERCQEGSLVAERALYQEGVKTMEKVSTRLKLAQEEQLRLEDESPAVAAVSRGRQSERLARAARHATKALTTLSNYTEANVIKTN